MKKMMLRIRYFMGICAILLSALLLSGCIKRDYDKTEKIMKAGVLNVGVIEGRSGLLTISGEDYIGQEADLVKKIAEKLELSIQFTIVENSEAGFAALDSGNVDLVIGSIAKDHVTGEYAVSEVYAEKPLYVVTKRGVYSNSVYTFQDGLIGLSKDVEQYNLVSFASFTTSQTRIFDNTETIEEELNTGMINGYFCYKEEAQKLLEHSDLLQVQNVSDADSEQFVIVTNQDNQKLLESINEVIEYGTF